MGFFLPSLILFSFFLFFWFRVWFLLVIRLCLGFPSVVCVCVCVCVCVRAYLRVSERNVAQSINFLNDFPLSPFSILSLPFLSPASLPTFPFPLNPCSSFSISLFLSPSPSPSFSPLLASPRLRSPLPQFWEWPDTRLVNPQESLRRSDANDAEKVSVGQKKRSECVSCNSVPLQ